MNLAAIVEQGKRKLAHIIAAFVFAFLIVIAFVWLQLNSPHNPTSTIIFEIQPGASLNQISARLDESGLLAYPGMFTLWARISGVADQLKAGEYEIANSLTPRQLLDELVSGNIKQYQLTLVEGWTTQEALNAIWSSPGIEKKIDSLSMSELANFLDLDFEHAEGLFFPDTYNYTKGTTDADILLRAHQRLLEILATVWEDRVGALPLETPYAALILASIIEKESSQQSERGDIAGVFIRRLEQRMRLQSDPTIIYGLRERFDGNLTRANIDEQTAYNTYRINGLPPTPIALPGRASIEASVNPTASDYLYFVATGDGSHYFSSTLEEHNEAVQRFQLN